MSGVIYAAIIAMWLAFLVPMWLRRHEEAGAEARSVKTFSTAMRVLSRRTPSETPETLKTPKTPQTTQRTDTTQPVPAAIATPSASAATRRRRLLFALLAATLAVVAAGFLTPVPLGYAAIPGTLLALFVGYLVVSGRRRSRRQTPVRRVRELEQAPVAYDFVSHGADTDVGAPLVRGYDRPPVVPEAARSEWQPVAIPSPTYVDAPPAPRQIRRIDLSAPGAWTSGRLVSAAVAAAARAVAADEERTVEVELPHARAVGD